jgi:hypothetical protein
MDDTNTSLPSKSNTSLPHKHLCPEHNGVFECTDETDADLEVAVCPDCRDRKEKPAKRAKKRKGRKGR